MHQKECSHNGMLKNSISYQEHQSLELQASFEVVEPIRTICLRGEKTLVIIHRWITKRVYKKNRAAMPAQKTEQ
jgi:membrane-bound acyltransferase YfiQ involved in biofilm formation